MTYQRFPAGAQPNAQPPVQPGPQPLQPQWGQGAPVYRQAAWGTPNQGLAPGAIQAPKVKPATFG